MYSGASTPTLGGTEGGEGHHRFSSKGSVASASKTQSQQAQAASPHHLNAAPTATPVGGRSFAAPALIRVLLTPATSSVTPDEFERMTRVVRRIESIHLADLPRSSARDSIPTNSPLSRAGEVHLSFVTSYDPSHAFLSPFSIHRQVLGVLGLGVSDGTAETTAALEQAPAVLRQLHPSAVVHRVFAFDTGGDKPQTVDLTSLKNAVADGLNDSADAAQPRNGAADDSDTEADLSIAEASMGNADGAAGNTSTSSAPGFAGRGAAGLYIFPAVRRDLKDVRFYLKTLIPDFIGALLDGLEVFVRGLQGKPLETPRETLEGAMATAPQSSPNKSLVTGAGVGAAASSAASRASALFSSFSAADKDFASSRKVSRGSAAVQNVAGIGPTGTGRYAKVKADFYLLVGDLWSALQTYDSCLSLLGKERALAGSQDSVWYASALEGWAVARVLVARMGGLVEEQAPCLTLPTGGLKDKDKILPPDQDTEQRPWTDIVTGYALALTIYSKCLAPASFLLDTKRSITPDTPRDYTHPLIHTSACLAFSRLLLAIWASGGWNGETFDQLLIGGVPPALAETSRPTLAVYMQHSTASGIERNEIAAPASQALTNSSTNALKLLDQVHLYSSLAAIYGCIGFARKEAYTIQRLQSLVIALIAQGISLQRDQSSSSSEALRAGDAAHGTMALQTFSVGAGHGSDSILVLALQICQTYGINIQPMPLVVLAKSHILHRASVDVSKHKSLSAPTLPRNSANYRSAGASLLGALSASAAYDEAANDPAFGWTEHQILILKDTIAICEMLQDKDALLFFALLLLRDFWPHLGFEEQFKLKDGIAKIMAEMDETDKSARLRYWGPRDILASIVLEPNAATMPRKAKLDESALGQDSASRQPQVSSAWKEKRRAPGIPSQMASNVLVQDETASFIVFLQNPLLVPLEIETIRLELEGIGNIAPRFETVERRGIILPPLCFHGVRLTGIPRGDGKMVVRGVNIKLPWCAERLFRLQHPQEDNEKSVWKAKTELDDRHSRTKKFGLDARSNASMGHDYHPERTLRADESPWTLPVIAKVPLVSLQPSSSALRNGAVAMCDGEERIVTVTLHNQSELPIDHLRFTFEDNAQRDTVELLAEGQLHAADVYELEHDLVHRPFITLASGADCADRHIAPKQRKAYVFVLHGKVDVTQANIRIEYGNAAASREMGRQELWVREAVYAFDVRVLPTVFLDSLEVTPLTSGSSSNSSDGGNGKALVAFSAHNLHTSTIELVLQASGASITAAENSESSTTSDEEAANTEVVESLAPHASVRLHLVMRRFPQSTWFAHHKKPVPRLIERQFVVSRVKRTAAEEQEQRVLFWARQALLARLSVPTTPISSSDTVTNNSLTPTMAPPQNSCSWTDLQSGCMGSVSLAGLRLEDVRAIEGLYSDPLSVSLSLAAQTKSPSDLKADDIAGKSPVDGAFTARAHDFIEVRASVRNRTERLLSLRYVLHAVTDDYRHVGVQQAQAQQVICTSGHMAGRVMLRAHRSQGSRLDDGDDEEATAVHGSVEASIRTGLCFLAKGTFHLILAVEEEDEEGGAAAAVLDASTKQNTEGHNERDKQEPSANTASAARSIRIDVY